MWILSRYLRGLNNKAQRGFDHFEKWFSHNGRSARFLKGYEYVKYFPMKIITILTVSIVQCMCLCVIDILGITFVENALQIVYWLWCIAHNTMKTIFRMKIEQGKVSFCVRLIWITVISATL